MITKSSIKCAMCNETLCRAYFRKGDSDKYCSRHCLKKAFNGVYVFKYTTEKDGGIKILGVAE